MGGGATESWRREYYTPSEVDAFSAFLGDLKEATDQLGEASGDLGEQTDRSGGLTIRGFTFAILVSNIEILQKTVPKHLPTTDLQSVETDFARYWFKIAFFYDTACDYSYYLTSRVPLTKFKGFQKQVDKATRPNVKRHTKNSTGSFMKTKDGSVKQERLSISS